MSSPPPNESTSTPRGKSKRPHASRHGSSLFSRLHRKHDAKRHPDQAPFLIDDRPDTPETEADADPEAQDEAPNPQPQSRVRYWLAALEGKLRRLGELAASKIQAATGAFGPRDLYRVARRNLKALFLAALLALVTVMVAMSLGFLVHHRVVDELLCTSPSCVHAASEILYNLSPDYVNIDACEHFDTLACQGFEQRHDLRPDQGDMFRGTLMAEDAQVTLRHILEGPVSDIARVDQKNFEKLKADYVACMDEDTIGSYDLKPLSASIHTIKTLYPVKGREEHDLWRHKPVLQTVTQSSGDETDITEAYMYMIQMGVYPLVALYPGADDKDPDSQIVFASPLQSAGLPNKEYYNNNNTVAKYASMMSSVLANFYDTSSNSTRLSPSVQLSVQDLAHGIVEFETLLARATPDDEDLYDITKSYNKLNLSEVDQILPQLSFGKIIQWLAPDDYSADAVVVASPTYLNQSSIILKRTSKQVIQGYLVWKTIQSYAARIESPKLQPLTRFNNELSGKEPDAKPERWRTCIDAADSDLGWILSKFFVDKAFSVESKDFGDQIVRDIKDSFVDFLTAASWMTDDNRNRAMAKVYAIDQKIGYPTTNPDILDPDALGRYYEKVTIKNDTFFENALQVAQFDTRQQWSKLGKPTSHDEWGMTVPTVNAYYNPAGNEIVFPAGIMQSPVFYDPSVPQYLSYGAFGAVSGHELSHAFDNTGSQYDETGRYVDWWSNETRAAFEEKTQCFVDQYSEYSITGPDGKKLHVNGRLTLGENVADAGGLHAAFKAWKRRDAEQPAKLLPGLEHFTKEQLFFVNYANWWCGKSTKETAVRRIYTDPHAPKWTRILGTMANSADFREAFKCPSKKPTCELW